MRASVQILSFLVAGLVLASSAFARQSPELDQINGQLDAFEALVGEARANMMADPSISVDRMDQAERLLDELSDITSLDTERATVSWLRAEGLTRLGRISAAMPEAERALAALGPEPAPTKLYADILVALGRIEKLTGEYGRSLEHLQQAYEVYRSIGESRSESIVLQSIGSIYTDAHQYERAVEYFALAAERYEGDPSLDLAAENNLGNTYRELGQYEQAQEHLQTSLGIAREMNSAMLQARILNNIASLHIAFADYDAAEVAIDEAFALAGSDSASAEWTRFLWGARAQIEFGRGDLWSARAALNPTFDGVDLSTTTSNFTEFHESAAEIYAAVGDYRTALAHQAAFKRLDDEAREIAASANTALLGAQFDFAEQALQIQELRTVGLEQALVLATAQARQRMMLLGGLIVFLLMLIGAALWRQRAAAERRRVLERSLYEDAETGLPTRAAAERSLRRQLANSGSTVKVMAIGIERFRHLEGILGFQGAAELRCILAARLSALVGNRTVFLFSPSVLGVLDIDTVVDSGKLPQLVSRSFEAPVNVGDLAIDVETTVGIAQHDAQNPGLKHALIALDQARAAKVKVASFDAALVGDPTRNLTLMSRMVAATQNGHMSLHYQPKLHVASARFMAAEALCRWRDPKEGVIAPDSFIPLAEETGRIRDFTLWALHEVVRDQAKFRAAGQHLHLALNISGALVADTDFAEKALGIVQSSPGEIAFELTETAAMRNPEQAMANMKRWVDAGVRLAIDDYGSGLSSLAYLKSLPAHELKLDRAFITHVARSQRDRMLVSSTVELAHGLGLEMTAEGVEDAESLALLQLLGCDWLQGYGLARPQPVESLILFLREQARLQAEVTPARLIKQGPAG